MDATRKQAYRSPLAEMVGTNCFHHDMRLFGFGRLMAVGDEPLHGAAAVAFAA